MFFTTVNRVPDAESYNASYYEENYLAFAQNWAPVYREVIQHTSQSLGRDLCGVNWLDIGSGSGLFLKELDTFGANGIGIEPSEAACKIARRNTNARIIQGDPLELPENRIQGTFDVISLIDVLAHVENPGELLSWCFKQLSENGVLVVKTPHRDLAYYQYHIRKFKKSPDFLKILFHLPYQNHSWSAEGLATFFQNAGFSSTQIIPFHEYAINSHALTLRDIFHPRRIIFKKTLAYGEKIQRFPSLLAIGHKTITNQGE